ncbi:MBL fold metallo-hydrolase [Alcaligenaceae bacterium LF4-65]|uniref:MBL fold metallo-hydrolase n=1 Tax=Zwartia hollandica TaxID=324606 RepID=A0A953NBE2_9BURK|nr:MBL fold metallo-hydrolase [Zwartia hollandica]MBZ1351985.1 MBL fold metallo-hydrolase [Zwartia hollandica]
MHAKYELLVRGNSLSFKGGFFGLCNVALVTAADGTRVLFDTGHYCVRKGLINGLKDRGLAPTDIDLVFLSHLHFDHCQNLDLFKGVPVAVGKTEIEYARNPHPDDLFIPWKIHDLLADFELRVLPQRGIIAPGIEHFEVPGHTTGCQALRFAQEDGRRVVLAGDAIKYPKEVLAQVGDMCFGSTEDSRRSIAEICANTDIVVPGHFPEIFRRHGNWIWDEPPSIELILR